jgi:transposase
MKPLSNDLRERIITAVDRREGSRRELARRFAVDPSCITRLLQLRRQTGSIEPRPHGGGKPPALDHDGLERLRLQQLRQELGVGGSIMIVFRALKRLGITRKKKTRHADERDRPDVRRKRRSFRRKVKPIEPKRLVFVDETGVTTAMTPTYGRAPRGERVIAAAPASWESVTVIAAMALDGVRAPLAFPGAVDAATFESYVEHVLVPALRPGDVVVFDNLSAHLGPAVFEAIERAGASVLPLPPYSPDYTPIEEMFSKVKGAMRSAAGRTKEAVYAAFGSALHDVTPKDIAGWFQDRAAYAMQL